MPPSSSGNYNELRSRFSSTLQKVTRSATGRFANHIAVAYGSATETSELISLACEDGDLSREEGRMLLERSHQCERLLLGLLKRYRAQPVR